MVSPAGILNARILIVDDKAANVLLLEKMLAGAGYTSVTSTTDSSTVCELYRKNRYDLIVLDLLMPFVDGFQVLEGLKAIETEGYLPVLVVTAQPGHKVRALAAGAKDFVSKPFLQVEVLTRIQNMLEVRLLLREARSYAKVLERYDQLTGLPNRTLCRELLMRAIERNAQRAGMVSVLAVAIDRFESVNDALGRPMGDALLRRVADRLVESIGPMDAAARLDGHEFALIVVTPTHDPQEAAAVAARVRAAVCAPIESEGLELLNTVSIGIAVCPRDTGSADSLMQQAETAMHAAREAGGNTDRLYAEEMVVHAAEELRGVTTVAG